MVIEYTRFVQNLVELKNRKEYKFSGSLLIIILLIHYLVLFFLKSFEKQKILKKKFIELNRLIMISIPAFVLSIVFSKGIFIMITIFLNFIFLIIIFFFIFFFRNEKHNFILNGLFLFVQFLNFLSYLTVFIHWIK